ncbi:2-hydroxyacyl-CoA dehydratase subunit D [Chloroflexota bacterium]
MAGHGKGSLWKHDARSFEVTGQREQPKEQKASGRKSLETAREAAVIRRRYYARLSNPHMTGEFVAWAMWGYPEPIFEAMDTIGSFAENYGPVCAVKQVGDHFCEIAESDGFSIDICSYLRTSLGVAKVDHDTGKPDPKAPYGGMGKPKMLIANAHRCDGRFKFLQQIARYYDAPFFAYDLLEWPDGWDENDQALKKHFIDHYTQQLRRLVAFMEKVTGKKMDKNRLSEATRNYVESKKWFHEASELRRCRPNPLPAADTAAVYFPSMVQLCRPETVQFCKNVYDEVKGRVDNKIGSVPGEEKYRIMWHLQIPWHTMDLLDWMADEFGASVMNDSYSGGEPPREELIDYDFPMESYARWKYDKGTSVGAMSFRRDKYDNILDMIRRYQIHGVIAMLVASCRGTASMYHKWKRLDEEMRKASLNIPTLGIEADMVDSRAYSDRLIKDQIKAFMETLDGARREREGAPLH